MSYITVSPSKDLKGEVNISGSKNASLPILAATIAVNGKTKLNNIPSLSDISSMTKLLSFAGCEIDIKNDKITIISDTISNFDFPSELTGGFRASFIISGALLARFGRVKLSMPGGCAIGTRPVDLHLKGLCEMGAELSTDNGYVYMSSNGLHGADIYLDFPSVGATENLLIAATLAKGKTELINAATEPEVTDLANFLVRCGANIHGIGTENLVIYGKSHLYGCEYTVIPDRIEAGTFMLLSAMSQGNIVINNICSEHLAPVCAKLKEMGITTEFCEDSLRVCCGDKILPAHIKTMPHPGFPTDMQSLFASLMCYATGTSIITETVFENRFMHLSELIRMNANIRIDGRTAIIEGSASLTGANVTATDLRSGAGLVLAAMGAKGTTTISNAHYIERGYDDFTGKLQSLGADITLVKDVSKNA